MRIAFLCGSLEPGRDGVGDYTRRLAAECIRQGHECRIVGLNDNGTSGLETQQCDGASINCLRCAGTLSSPERVRQAQDFLARFDPDCISLQFVAYGFHPKGVPWRLPAHLKSIIAGRPLHIMFHELWSGFGKNASLKERMVGALQRHCILRTIRVLRPRTVSTSNATYGAMLKAAGVAAAELPLFGNIPVLDVGSAPTFPAQLVAAGISDNPRTRKDWSLALFFGTLHPEWNPEPFVSILLRAAKQTGKRVCFLSVGRLGTAGEARWETMQRDYGDEIAFVKFGEQPCDQISTLLQLADFGIAASPLDLIGKSGSVAAMLDHGLPFIVTRDEERHPVEGTRSAPADPLLHRCDATLEAKLIAGLPKREPCPRLDAICARFVAGLPIP